MCVPLNNLTWPVLNTFLVECEQTHEKCIKNICTISNRLPMKQCNRYQLNELQVTRYLNYIIKVNQEKSAHLKCIFRTYTPRESFTLNMWILIMTSYYNYNYNICYDNLN